MVYSSSLDDRWARRKVDWPVPFPEIVEWLPNDGGDGYGIIRTAGGEWWYHRMVRDERGDRSREWARLSLAEILESRERGDRRT